MAQKAKGDEKPLIEICLGDEEFQKLWGEKLTEEEKAVLDGKIELYIGTSLERATANIAFARAKIARTVGVVLT